MLATRHGFDTERVVELLRRENVCLRGLERHEGDDGDRVVLLVKLRPRDRPERLADGLRALEGVHQVEWER